jgi:hypothetical protein
VATAATSCRSGLGAGAVASAGYAVVMITGDAVRTVMVVTSSAWDTPRGVPARTAPRWSAEGRCSPQGPGGESMPARGLAEASAGASRSWVDTTPWPHAEPCPYGSRLVESRSLRGANVRASALRKYGILAGTLQMVGNTLVEAERLGADPPKELVKSSRGAVSGLSTVGRGRLGSGADGPSALGGRYSASCAASVGRRNRRAGPTGCRLAGGETQASHQ